MLYQSVISAKSEGFAGKQLFLLQELVQLH